MDVEHFSLKIIDLSKSFDCDHPDIKTGRTQYLVRHRGRWHIGTFGREWYGLHFNLGSHCTQFDDARYPDKPTDFEALFEICEGLEKEPDTRNLRKVRIKE